MARNVGVNSTFEQQRLVINELAVDVETLENAGYITGYTEQDNLGTVLARGNQATSDILLTGIITATSFVGDGSNLTGISAGAGGTDNVSTSTLSVAGVSTFNGRIVGSATTNIIPFLYANLSDLPSASDYHGAFAHVHATGKAYYAHSGAWVELVNAGTDGTVGTGNENYNVGVITGTTINATSFVGDGSGLTGVVAQGTGIVIQEEGSSVGTAGTINFIGAGVTATLAGGIASVEITTSGSTYTDSDVDTHLNTGTASNNEVLSWTGSDYDWVAQSAGGISNVLEDTTPQLGGNLDINNKYIIGTGGANITGVVTATRFESTSAGTPTIDSPNNLNINAVTVAISTNLTAGGSITAAQFVGDGSGLTGVVAQGTGIVIQEEGSSVGTAGTINFIGAGVTATLANGIASVEITSSGGSGITTANINADTLNVTGVSTFNNNVSLGGTSGDSNITGLSRLELYDSAANVVIGNTDTASSIDLDLVTTVENVFIGLGAGQNFQQGNGNNIIGYYAGKQGTVGGSDYAYFNNIIGYNAAQKLTSGSYNQAIGEGALQNLTSGDRNIAIGNYPGFGVTTGDHNILLGDSADVTNGSDSFNIVIGKDITVNGNNNLAIGINGEKLITGVKDGSVELYYNNLKKFETTGAGVTVTGILTATSFVGDGSNITGISTLNITDYGVGLGGGGGGDTVTINATATDILSVSSGDISADDPGADRLVFWDDSESKLTYLTAGSGLSISGTEITATGGTETDTLATVTARGNTTTQEITATNFRSNDTTGDGSDIGFAIKYYITEDGTSSAYRFAGPGVLNTTDDPTLYFHRGFTYILENSTGSSHPFELRVSAGGAAYAPGGNFLTGSINGTQILTVPFDAPGSIVYQCTLHSGMVGTINFVS